MSMPMSGGGGGIHVLCDDALAEIFVRLPSVSVLRCGAVCRSWRRVTSGRAFLTAHAARQPRELVTRWGALESIPFSLGPLDTDRRRRRRFLCDYATAAHKGQCNVCYSLDGLLLLRQRGGLYAVCNPATRQWTSLPQLAPEPCYVACSCGFYLHAPYGEYRLLCHGVEKDPSRAFDKRNKAYHYVLSAGATAPRRLGSAPWHPHHITIYEDPVAHRGALHWLSEHPEAASTGKMLAFDTASETFRLMSRPPDMCRMMMRCLFELDGELNVAAMRSLTSLDVWVLKDYRRESWALRCRVEVPMPWSYGYNKVSVRTVIPTGSGGAILIGSPGSPVARVYDIKEKRVICRDFTFEGAILKFLVYGESLVRHAFFDSPPRCHELLPMIFSN